jgi:hypothetical protein
MMDEPRPRSAPILSSPRRKRRNHHPVIETRPLIWPPPRGPLAFEIKSSKIVPAPELWGALWHRKAIILGTCAFFLRLWRGS